MTTVYKCIKGFTDRSGDRVRIGQEFVIKERDMLGYRILNRKSGRGSSKVIPTHQFSTYFQEVKKELATSKNELKAQETLERELLPVSTKVVILVDNPAFADLVKGDVVTIEAYLPGGGYQVTGGWGIFKFQCEEYVDQDTKVVEPKKEFKVGDRVMIAKSSVYYNTSPANPSHLVDIVYKSYKRDSMEFCYEVEWANDRRNSYKEGDLVAYKEEKEELVNGRLPVGTKVRILKDNPSGAKLNKGDICTIEQHYGVHSYKVSGNWLICKDACEEYTPEYSTFTKEFDDILTFLGIPLRVGMGAVAGEDKFKCFIHIR